MPTKRKPSFLHCERLFAETVPRLPTRPNFPNFPPIPLAFPAPGLLRKAHHRRSIRIANPRQQPAAFMLQQPTLRRQPAAISCQGSIGPDHPMTRHDD